MKWRIRSIVPDGEVTDEMSQISATEAKAIDADYDVGDECYEQLTLEEFGRRSIMAARQTLISRIMDLEKTRFIKESMWKGWVKSVVGEVSRS